MARTSAASSHIGAGVRRPSEENRRRDGRAAADEVRARQHDDGGSRRRLCGVTHSAAFSR